MLVCELRRSLFSCPVIGVVVGVVFCVLAESSQVGQPHKALEIYFVDVEGGQATLFVTPKGQSLLIDTGWPGYGGRDADRIVAAAKKAGLSKIDFVLLTHYHVDHAGGAAPLFARIRVGAFIDHGANREPGDGENGTELGGLPEAGVKPACHTNHRESGRQPAYRRITCGNCEF